MQHALVRGRFTEELNIEYRLEAEVFAGRLRSRVSIKGADKPNDHVIERRLTLNDQFATQEKCKAHIVYVKVSSAQWL